MTREERIHRLLQYVVLLALPLGAKNDLMMGTTGSERRPAPSSHPTLPVLQMGHSFSNAACSALHFVNWLLL